MSDYSPSEAARAYVHNLGIGGPKSWGTMVAFDAGRDDVQDLVDRIRVLSDDVVRLEAEVMRLDGQNARLGKVNATLSTYAFPPVPVTIFPATL